MPLTRRRFLGRVAGGTLAAQLPVASPGAESTGGPGVVSGSAAITPRTLAEAEKIAGLAFTPAQRAPVVPRVAASAAAYADLRKTPPPNSVAPALRFTAGWTSGTHPTGNTAPGTARELPATVRPASDDDLAFLSIDELAALLRSRQVTARELTELALRRLRAFDGTLHAVITLTEARARRQADAADAEIRGGRWRGPLHGIPWGAKDLLAVRGYPTTWGAAPFKNQHFDHDADVVRRLDAAGAILVAKLSLGALAYGDTWFGGQTKCPWNIDVGSSGSSAGPCAAVAAGLVPFAIGSETLGSIVSPCTRNGVTGLRPTYGRVSRAGTMSLAWSMDKLGPITRSAAGCAVVFEAIHGADPADPASIDVPFDWRPASRLDGWRVGFVRRHFDESGEWHDANDGALATLRELGAELVPIELPAAPVEALRMILNVEAAAVFDDLTRDGRIDHVIAPNVSNWADTLREARFVPAVDYLQANRHRALLVDRLEQVLLDARVDVWVSPPFGDHLFLTNATGHPTVCVPSGFRPARNRPAGSSRSDAGSLSIHARLWRDDRALVVADAFQSITSWHRRRPPAT